MKTFLHTRVLFPAILSVLLVHGTLRADEDNSPTPVQVERGSAAFKVASNMPGIEIRGKSSMLSANVAVGRNTNGALVLQHVSASLPVDSLTTGIRLRDEHMRKYIFTAPDGQIPDLQFRADPASCTASTPPHEFDCRVSGALSIRGMPRSLSLHLHIKEQSGLLATFHVSGDAVVNLSDYGIAPPSQFGVRPSSKVDLYLDLTGRQKSMIASGGGKSQ